MDEQSVDTPNFASITYATDPSICQMSDFPGRHDFTKRLHVLLYILSCGYTVLWLERHGQLLQTEKPGRH